MQIDLGLEWQCLNLRDLCLLSEGFCLKKCVEGIAA